MKRVVIESPLSATSREGIEENKKYARRAMLDCISRGEAPFASHLLYEGDEILNDLVQSQRNIGISMGLEWGRMADVVVVYADRGVSKGMQMGMDFYRHCSIPIEYRYLDRPKDVVEAESE